MKWRRLPVELGICFGRISLCSILISFSVSSHLRHFVFAPLSVKVSTFQRIKKAFVKTGISGRLFLQGRTILAWKIVINKFKSSISC